MLKDNFLVETLRFELFCLQHGNGCIYKYLYKALIYMQVIILFAIFINVANKITMLYFKYYYIENNFLILDVHSYTQSNEFMLFF